MNKIIKTILYFLPIVLLWFFWAIGVFGRWDILSLIGWIISAIWALINGIFVKKYM
jgi:hypothetical protein